MSMPHYFLLPLLSPAIDPLAIPVSPVPPPDLPAESGSSNPKEEVPGGHPRTWALQPPRAPPGVPAGPQWGGGLPVLGTAEASGIRDASESRFMSRAILYFAAAAINPGLAREGEQLRGKLLGPGARARSFLLFLSSRRSPEVKISGKKGQPPAPVQTGWSFPRTRRRAGMKQPRAGHSARLPTRQPDSHQLWTYPSSCLVLGRPLKYRGAGLD